MKSYLVDSEGYYGEFGGAYVPEILHKCVEDLQRAAKTMIRDCKEFLGGDMEEKQREFPAFCELLSSHVAKLETVSG